MSIRRQPLAGLTLTRSKLPLQEQLYVRIRQAIAEGRILPGERLPAARTLASDLAIARGTVDGAYGRLAGEGYVITRGAAGTVVSPELRVERRTARPRRQATLTTFETTTGVRPFQPGLPALDRFPRALWGRLTARAGRRLAPTLLAYPDPLGLPELRQAIAAYLAVSRGVSCEPGQIVITAGYQAGLDLIVRLLLHPGDQVWFEEPGYFLARHSLQAAGLTLQPVPVDDEGLDVAAAVSAAPRARLAVVTPSHQSPLGVALSLTRRQDLLAWASEARAWIVEDDYDGEFHYVGRKLPALKSLDSADRVIYAGSFSKTLFPALRLGYLVIPHALQRIVEEARRRTIHGEPVLGQMVTAEFLTGGHFGRHLKRMRALYTSRRAALLRALNTAFGSDIDIADHRGGLILQACFPASNNDVVLARSAEMHSLAPLALSSQYLGRPRAHGLLLSFTNVDEEQADRLARRLHRSLASHL